MTNLRTNQDIINNALVQAGELPNANSDFFNQALIYYNSIHRAICSGGSELDPSINEDWEWLKKPTPGILILQPSTTGLVSIAQGSANATLAIAPSISIQGQLLWIPGDSGDFYIIQSHTGGLSSITLDSVYTGTTNAAATYKAAQLEYDLASDFDSFIGPMKIPRSGQEISEIDLSRMNLDYPYSRMIAGTPSVFGLVDDQRVRFNTYPSETSTEFLRVEYDYKIRPVDLSYDTGEPLVPFNKRQVLSNWVTAYILMDKDDDKQSTFLAMAKAGLQGMVLNRHRGMERAGRNMGQIITRQDQVGKRVPQSTSGHIFPWYR